MEASPPYIGSLVGAWRLTMGEAIDDAIQAGQARAEPDGDLTWIVSGKIERGPREG